MVRWVLCLINGISIGSDVLVQLSADSPYISQLAALPFEIASSVGDLDPISSRQTYFNYSHLTHGSLGASKSIHPKRHLDQFSRFCGAHDCDRPTDRQTENAGPPTIGRTYVRSTAMRPNNTEDQTAVEPTLSVERISVVVITGRELDLDIGGT